MTDHESVYSLPDAAVLPAGWADKTDELLVKKPVVLRGWFLQLLLVLGLIAAAAAALGGVFLYRWHRTQQDELATQRRSVEAFTRSPAFAAFAHKADAQLVAALNFATLRPDTVTALLPTIAAAEKARHQMPWVLEIPPLPVSAAEHPARVRTAALHTVDLLTQRGLAFDPPRITEARRAFLRLLTPHAQIFLAENTGSAFPALFLDRRMQDIVLTAYAARAGGTREEAERIFVLYALIGPALWKEIETMSARPTAPGL